MSNPDIDDSSENVLSDWPRYGSPPEEDEESAAEPFDHAAEVDEVDEVELA